MLQQIFRYYLNDENTPIAQVVDLIVTGLVLVSSAIFVAETYPIPDDVRQVLDIADQVILGVFTVEYGLRLWAAEHKLKHVFSLYSLIDLLAIVPFYWGASDIRFIRIFRWFRILRLIRFVEGKTIVGYLSREDSAILARILFTLFAIIFVYSGLIYQVEHPRNPEGFATFLDAVYFSVATMSTVGFGDITPVSEIGRLLTVLMILTGIALIPWQLGDLIKQLVKTSNQVEIACPGCELSRHETDARYCKICGDRLIRMGESCDLPSLSSPLPSDRSAN